MKKQFRQWLSGGIWWLPLMILVVFTAVFLSTKSEYETYNRVKAEGQTAVATVIRIDEFHTSDDTDYHAYVSYTYGGREYTDVRLPGQVDPDRCFVGDEQQILIDTQDGNSPVLDYKPTNPYVFLWMGVVVFAISMAISCFPLMFFREKSKTRG